MSANARRAESGEVSPFPNAKAAPAAEPVRRASRRRLYLMLSLPLALLLVGGYFWLASGRYVSTDNAYVQQDKVLIVPEVEGRIVEVGGVENQPVEKGQLLFRIDATEYQVAVQQAEAEVASARLDVERLKAAYAKAQSDQQMSEEALRFAKDTFDRQEALQKRGVVAQSGLDEARMNLQQAEAATRGAEQAVLGAKAALANDPSIPTDSHPLVMQALAKLARARLDLEHTSVSAPAAGVISQADRLQVGEYVTSGSSVLTLVETGKSWIEANFKETELTYLRPGQHAVIDVDTYPGEDFEGTVESLGAGTGAEFSLLPAQNATGNWVKVVQRVPVRIALSTNSSARELRAGMSAHVSVDTGRATILGSAIEVMSPSAFAHPVEAAAPKR